MNRRRFLQRATAVGAGAPLLGPAILRCGWPSERVRVGVIGVGSRGQDLMRHALRLPNVEITALCDVFAPRFAAGREMTGTATPAYTDHRQMLNAEAANLDAVLVASPLSFHAEHVLAALEHGCHVYGEKSMAYTVEGCDAITQAVAEAGRVFQVGHQFRYAPWAREAMQRIHEGEIGAVTHVFGYWHRNTTWRRPVPLEPPPGWTEADLERLINWRMYLDYSRGLLAELGSHHIDFANWAFGALPTSVAGSGSIVMYDDGRETYDNLQATFDYPGGRRLVFSSLLNNHKVGYQVWIVGTEGNAILTLEDATFFYEPYRPNSSMEAPSDSSGAPRATTTASLSTSGDMPYRGRGQRVAPVEGSGDATLIALDAFIGHVRSGTRPFTDEHVGWGSAIPVAFGHQAIRTKERIDFGEHVAAHAAATPDP